MYTQAWVTSPALTDAPGVALVAAGRRGQIEQENPTVLKTSGYHCEHNDGPGQHPLAALWATWLLLAYLGHPVLA